MIEVNISNVADQLVKMLNDGGTATTGIKTLTITVELENGVTITKRIEQDK